MYRRVLKTPFKKQLWEFFFFEQFWLHESTLKSSWSFITYMPTKDKDVMHINNALEDVNLGSFMHSDLLKPLVHNSHKTELCLKEWSWLIWTNLTEYLVKRSSEKRKVMRSFLCYVFFPPLIHELTLTIDISFIINCFAKIAINRCNTSPILLFWELAMLRIHTCPY